MLYFINECCEVYPWPGTAEEQREEFPMDDHTPYATFDEAETAAEAAYRGYSEQTIRDQENDWSWAIDYHASFDASRWE